MYKHSYMILKCCPHDLDDQPHKKTILYLRSSLQEILDVAADHKKNLHMRPIKLTLGLLVLILVILLVAAGAIWYQNFGPNSNAGRQRYSSTVTPYQVLMQNNEAFIRAESALNSGDYEQAQTLYEQALAQAKDNVQRGQIQYKIAIILAKQKKYDLAIPMFKAIIADPLYERYAIVKAYSLQALGEMYYASGDPAISKMIFSDEPYASMLSSSNGDETLAYRKLSELALLFYPLGISELRYASWYVNDYANGSRATSSASILNIVNDAVVAADADMERIKTDPNQATTIPDTLTRECALYLKVYEAKLDDTDKADTVCNKALDMFTSIGKPEFDGFTRFYYAVLLADESKYDQMATILQPFSKNSSKYSGQYILSFLTQERTNQLKQKERLVTLASHSSGFKDFLISLGWDAQDFN